MKILVFPKDPNPYQELLYTSMEGLDKDIHIKYLTGPTGLHPINLILLPALLVFYRIRGYRIFHIHWFYIFRIPSLDFGIFKTVMKYYCLLFMYFTKLLGYKLIWTIHEVIAHTAITDNDIAISQSISQRMSLIANVKIIHSSSVIDEMLENKLNIDNSVIIPHGSYVGVYPDSITRDKAREELEIKPKEIMILFFGLVRPYKGVDDLIEAYSKLITKHVKLVIVGKCIDLKLNKKILKYQKSIKFEFYNGHVSDDEVAKYFKASDIVCLPFKEITTSGSVLLALSFGKPIVAPRIGVLIDLPADVGFLYDPSRADSLFLSLTEAISSKHLDRMSESASRYTESLSWDKIAEQTYKVYKEVLSS